MAHANGRGNGNGVFRKPLGFGRGKEPVNSDLTDAISVGRSQGNPNSALSKALNKWILEVEEIPPDMDIPTEVDEKEDARLAAQQAECDFFAVKFADACSLEEPAKVQLYHEPSVPYSGKFVLFFNGLLGLIGIII